MRSFPTRFAKLIIVPLLIVIVGPAPWLTGEVFCAPETALDNGKMTVCWKKPTKPTAKSSLSAVTPTYLLIHFHGAPKTLQAAFERTDLDAVLVIVNFPGLSSAYSKPFASDPRLFDEILERTKRTLPSETNYHAFEWKRVSLSSFSAGYGAVREILKAPKAAQQVDDIVAADSIYAGLQEDEPSRQVDEVNMRDFLEFAKKAAQSKKRFTISHSSQSTPYASTTETANYLLRALKLGRRERVLSHTDQMRQLSIASVGQFVVLGFAGESGQHHMQHLHHIDLFWNTLVAPAADVLEKTRPENTRPSEKRTP